MDREPAVAGRFYPGESEALAAEVASLLAERPGGRATAGNVLKSGTTTFTVTTGTCP